VSDKEATSEDFCLPPGESKAGANFIALVEKRPFLRDCIARNMQSAFSLPVHTVASLSELSDSLDGASAELVILSMIECGQEAWMEALKVLSEDASGRPVVILASTNDVDMARTAIRHGAKGYIPITMGFDIAVEAIRFILVGGTYAPTDYLTTNPLDLATPTSLPATSILTARELSVVAGIKQGKPNKTIAYELNMCESTVKVHMRNIMKKLNAKNRTEVAMRS
jgi:DNA-binding NarL/FixJ family response regulator